ncbi:hypothetical protein [Nitratifractor salsuginis]|uniref:Uncharacterized protein n=1 Tax=Nitratifractor salsuginis (strain DSM 16511 / JCM 12458 / E9I37-1) TaxID=749222 RepID=E6X1A8_NITSE|nr:hypothetical protein [Nitratifractor salsuginis]ADV46970.1 hypothetical protein Nitsa_1724 [Nitratifractor salsuginis DSM 16511]
MKQENKKYLFIVNYGVEYRNFFLSGLSNQFPNHIVFERNLNSSLFVDYIEKYILETKRVNRSVFEKKRNFIEDIFQSVRQSRMTLKKIGIFKNYNMKINKISIRDHIKGNMVIYNILRTLVLSIIPRYYRDEQIVKLFKENKVTDIIISGYSSTASIAFAVNAISNDINVWVLVNSWKDLYINEFVPFSPSGLFVWSEEMKHNYLSLNTHLNPSKVYAYGNPVFDRFYKYKPKYSRSYYEKKYSIKPSQPILLYTMLDPDRYSKEHVIIGMIGDALLEKYDEAVRPKIVVRRNPFDPSEELLKYFADHEAISVADHFSERDKDNDFFVQSIEGEDEWMDLLYYSSMNIGAASTVALEALMLGKPVITVAFDHDDRPSRLLLSMAEAPFYKSLLDRQDVSLVKSCKECLESIDNFLRQTGGQEGLPEILGIVDGRAAQRIAEEIKNG